MSFIKDSDVKKIADSLYILEVHLNSKNEAKLRSLVHDFIQEITNLQEPVEGWTPLETGLLNEMHMLRARMQSFLMAHTIRNGNIDSLRRAIDHFNEVKEQLEA